MKRLNLVLLSTVAFCLTGTLLAETRTFFPVVRTGDRVASAPVLIDQVFGPMDSKVRAKGRYVLGAVKGVIEPEDRPRSLSELGFRSNAAVHVQGTALSILLQIKGLDPPSPSQGVVSNCVMKLTLRAAK